MCSVQREGLALYYCVIQTILSLIHSEVGWCACSHLCVTILCAQELASTFGSELKGRESVWLRPRQAQQSFRYLSMGIEQLETLEAAEIFEAAGVIVGRDHRLSARWNTEAYTVAHQWGNLHRSV